MQIKMFSDYLSCALNCFMFVYFQLKRLITPKLYRYGKPLPEFEDFAPKLKTQKTKARQDGNELYSQWYLGERMVTILTADLAKQFYKSGLGSKSQNEFFGYAYQRFCNVMLGAKDGEEWRQLKLPLINFYSYKGVQENMQVIDRETTAWLLAFQQKMLTKDIFSVADLGIEKQAQALLGSLLYGELSNGDKRLIEDVSKLNVQAFHTAEDISARFGWFTNYFPNSTVDITEKTWNLWVKWNKDKIKEYHENDSHHVTLFSKMGEYECYKDERVYFQTMYEMLILNLDIMAHALSNLMYAIAARPDLQQEIFEELNEYNDAQISHLASLNDLPLIRSVMNEVARLEPALEFSLPETLTDDWVLNGMTIPKGTKVTQNLRIINRDETVFENANDFDPYRFQDSPGIKKLSKFHRFGLGSRKCIGNVYADYFLVFSIDRIVRNYTMKLVETEAIMDQRDGFAIVNCNLVNDIQFTSR